MTPLKNLKLRYEFKKNGSVITINNDKIYYGLPIHAIKYREEGDEWFISGDTGILSEYIWIASGTKNTITFYNLSLEKPNLKDLPKDPFDPEKQPKKIIIRTKPYQIEGVKKYISKMIFKGH